MIISIKYTIIEQNAIRCAECNAHATNNNILNK